MSRIARIVLCLALGMVLMALAFPMSQRPVLAADPTPTVSLRTIGQKTPTPGSAPAPTQPAAAPTQPAATTGDAYVSPTFGYSLAIDPAVWTVTDQSSSESGDFLSLESPNGLVEAYGIPMVYDQQTCVDKWLGVIADRYTASTLQVLNDTAGQPMRQEGPDGATAVITFELNGYTYYGYVDCRPLAEPEGVFLFYQITFEYPSTLAGGEREALLSTLTLPGQAPAAADYDVLYEAYNFGLVYDTSYWTVYANTEAADYSQLILQSSVAQASFLVAPNGYVGKLLACVTESATAVANGLGAVITPLNDANGAPVGSDDPTLAFRMYSTPNSDGTDSILYVVCESFQNDAFVLISTLYGTRANFETALTAYSEIVITRNTTKATTAPDAAPTAEPTAATGTGTGTGTGSGEEFYTLAASLDGTFSAAIGVAPNGANTRVSTLALSVPPGLLAFIFRGTCETAGASESYAVTFDAAGQAVTDVPVAFSDIGNFVLFISTSALMPTSLACVALVPYGS